MALDTSQLSLDPDPRHTSPVTSVTSSIHNNYNGGQVIDPIHAQNILNTPQSVLSLNLTGDQSQQHQHHSPQQQQLSCSSPASPKLESSTDKFFAHGFQANSLLSQFEQFRVVNDIGSVPMVSYLSSF